MKNITSNGTLDSPSFEFPASIIKATASNHRQKVNMLSCSVLSKNNTTVKPKAMIKSKTKESKIIFKERNYKKYHASRLIASLLICDFLIECRNK